MYLKFSFLFVALDHETFRQNPFSRAFQEKNNLGQISISVIIRNFLIVIFFQIFPDSATVHLFGDVDVRRDGDLDDVAVGHGNLDRGRSVPQAVTRSPIEFVVLEKILKAKRKRKKILIQFLVLGALPHPVSSFVYQVSISPTFYD